MRRNKNTLKDDPFRLCKTPSPTIFSQLKSPRLLKRDSNHNQQNKKTNVQDAKMKMQQNKQVFDVFRASLLQSKQKETILNEGERIKSKFNQKNTQSNYKRIVTDTQNNPYGPLFQYKMEKAIQKEANDRVSRSNSRKSSVISEISEKGADDTRNSYQQTIRKLANENIKLKHQLKVLHDKWQKLINENKNIKNQSFLLQSEVNQKQSKMQQIEKRNKGINQENKMLRKTLQINCQQLNQSNYEIYKMRQQIFELNLLSQKSQASSKSTLSFEKANIQKKSSVESKINCKMCRQNTRVITQLTTSNQNIRFQLMQKNNIISNLCSDLQKMQNHQKNNNYCKKYQTLINQLSQEIMAYKFKQANKKYLKMAFGK